MAQSRSRRFAAKQRQRKGRTRSRLANLRRRNASGSSRVAKADFGVHFGLAFSA